MTLAHNISNHNSWKMFHLFPFILFVFWSEACTERALFAVTALGRQRYQIGCSHFSVLLDFGVFWNYVALFVEKSSTTFEKSRLNSEFLSFLVTEEKFRKIANFLHRTLCQKIVRPLRYVFINFIWRNPRSKSEMADGGDL